METCRSIADTSAVAVYPCLRSFSIPARLKRTCRSPRWWGGSSFASTSHGLLGVTPCPNPTLQLPWAAFIPQCEAAGGYGVQATRGGRCAKGAAERRHARACEGGGVCSEAGVAGMLLYITPMRPRKCTGRSTEHSVLCIWSLWLFCSHAVMAYKHALVDQCRGHRLRSWHALASSSPRHMPMK